MGDVEWGGWAPPSGAGNSRTHQELHPLLSSFHFFSFSFLADEYRNASSRAEQLGVGLWAAKVKNSVAHFLLTLGGNEFRVDWEKA